MRKLDYYGQVVLLTLIVLTALLFYFNKSFLFLSMIGLFILGFWQIISALTVTFSHHLKIYNHFIRNYWVACISMLLIFAGVFVVARFQNNLLINWLFGISTTGGLITSFYYLYLYKRYFLIAANNESDTVATSDGSLLPEL